MKDQALAFNAETDPAKSRLQTDLDDVIRSLEKQLWKSKRSTGSTAAWPAMTGNALLS
jgi:hypothetical protein